MNKQLPLPQVLRLDLTTSCNLKCIHCDTGNGFSPKGIMGWETFEQIYQRIKEYTFRVVVLYHGGEPLLNKHFFKIAERMRSHAIKGLKTVTNGTLLKDEMIKKILASPLDQIEISLDGTSHEENEFIRQGINSREVCVNVVKMAKLKRESGLAKPEIFIANCQIPTRPGPINRPIEIPAYLRETFKTVEDQIPASHYKCTWALVWPRMPALEWGSIDGNFCDHIVSTITIRYNGEVSPCCYDLSKVKVMGNILENSLPEIWNNSLYQDLRRAIGNFDAPAVLCGNCSVVHSQVSLTQDYLSNQLVRINQRT